MMKDYKVEHIPLHLIDKNPLNPRGRGEEGDVKHLMESIRDSSLYYPILVNRKDDRFQIIEGHRRFAVFATLKERNPEYASIPALVIEVGQEYMARIFREINDTAKKLTGAQWLDVFALGGKPNDLPKRLAGSIKALGELFDQDELLTIARKQGPSVHGLARRVGKWLTDNGKSGYDPESKSDLRKLIAWLVNSGDSVNVRVAMKEGTADRTAEAITKHQRLGGAAFPDGEVVAYVRKPEALAA